MIRSYYLRIARISFGIMAIATTPTSLKAQQLSKNADALQLEQVIVVPLFLLALALFMMILKRKEKPGRERKCKVSKGIPEKRHVARQQL